MSHSKDSVVEHGSAFMLVIIIFILLVILGAVFVY
ncbi:YjcZ family sporulation protein [Evansella clarkii]|nr:YjcZ family sporulation protein [Evansella clarkii]